MSTEGETQSTELARRAADGDHEAVELLLERHLPELRAFVRLRAGPGLRARESASDLVQSTCREVLTHIDRFQFPSDSAFRRWMFTMAMRKIANRAEHFAAAKRAEPGAAGVPGDRIDAELGGGDELLAACYQRFSSPSYRMGIKDEIELVESAFDSLTEEQREVVTLAHVVGLSRAEIGAELGKSENAVRIVLHRALARLAERVKGES